MMAEEPTEYRRSLDAGDWSRDIREDFRKRSKKGEKLRNCERNHIKI